MKAVLDVNVLISATLAPSGSPARLLSLWVDGGFELICSPILLDELTRALAYPKLRKRIPAIQAERLVLLLDDAGTVVADPVRGPSVRASDAGDDYLIALAEHARAALVTGDRQLLDLAGLIPVYSTTDFLALVESES